MKTYVLTVSNNFMSRHPRKGQPTGFEEKILSGGKIHTIRGNFDYWKKIIDEVNAGNAVLSVRKWNGKPYNSKQKEIKQFTKLGFQQIEVRAIGASLGISLCNNDIHIREFGPLEGIKLANNDGLNIEDFYYWFEGEIKQYIVIHFTDFRY